MSTSAVILVDDHALVRRGLAALLQASGRYHVAAEAADGAAALAAAPCARLMLLDLSLPGMHGLDVLTQLRVSAPALRVCVCSMHDEAQFVTRALSLGAAGYVLKQSLDDELFAALDTIAQGGIYLSPALRERPQPAVVLSTREREVLAGIARGQTTAAIAQSLGISAHTAVRHRANLMQKLSAHNTAELLRAARERGWTQ
jgi:DNA-binding NarL/FixJ family response regulator